MSSRLFLLFYLLCFGLCVGFVQIGRVLVRIERPGAAEPQPGVLVAVPPKPITETRALELAQARGASGSNVLYDEAGCRQRKGDFQGVCFQALAMQRAIRDLEGALDACRQIQDERLMWECYGDVAETHVPTSLPDSLSVCTLIPRKKWQDQCFFGIAVALSFNEPASALDGCERAGMWRDYCRHDVLGEVSTYNLDFVLDVCGREEGDLLSRKSCWHGIGKYIGRKDLPRALQACERVPEGPSGIYRQNCVHGAGWASGEKRGALGASICVQAGAQRDSCVLGVAYSIKRMDTEAAIGLCAEIRSDALREQCQGFLRR